MYGSFRQHMSVWTGEHLGQSQTGPRTGWWGKERWGCFSEGLGPTAALSHPQDTMGCKKSYQFPAVRCIQPFHYPLLSFATWINRVWEIGQEIRKEKGGKDPFGTCLLHAIHPSCLLYFHGLGRLSQTTTRQMKNLAMLIFIVVDLPQLTGNEAWAAEARLSEILPCICHFYFFTIFIRHSGRGDLHPASKHVSLSMWLCP